MNRSSPILFLLLIMSISSGLQAQTVYSDSEFDVASDWTVYGPFFTPESATNTGFDAQQAFDGLNSYLQVTVNRGTVNSGDVSTWGAVINNAFVWDPSDAQQGAIATLAVQFDLVGGGAWSLTVEQDGFVWFALAKRVVRNTSEPFFVSIQGLAEQDFVPFPGADNVFDNQPMHPDFSANGAPISFGIGVGFSCPSTSNCTATSELIQTVDNLLIEVCKAININAGLNDAWFNSATAGQGFFFTVYPLLEAMFVAWFTYDTERPDVNVEAMLGEPGHRWVTAFGAYAGNSAILDIELTSGGVFNSIEPMPTQAPNYGTMTLSFCDCGSASLTYEFPSLGLMGEIPLTRIANDNIAACEALSANP